jgi:hypothetical protein
MGADDDDRDYSLRRNGFGAPFWASILFCGLCAIAGLAYARFAPTLFAPRSVHAPAASAAPSVHGRAAAG